MENDTSKPPPVARKPRPPSEQEARRDREAKALRANLKRRKDQAREREAGGKGEG